MVKFHRRGLFCFYFYFPNNFCVLKILVEPLITTFTFPMVAGQGWTQCIDTSRAGDRWEIQQRILGWIHLEGTVWEENSVWLKWLVGWFVAGWLVEFFIRLVTVRHLTNVVEIFSIFEMLRGIYTTGEMPNRDLKMRRFGQVAEPVEKTESKEEANWIFRKRGSWHWETRM